MQLKSLHNFFKNGLIGYYPKEEIDAFFYRICDMHLNLKRIDITLKSDMIVAAKTFEYFEMVIERLLNYEPIQYILGSTFFFGSDSPPVFFRSAVTAWIRANPSIFRLLLVGSPASPASPLPNFVCFAVAAAAG